jgi:serine/threonine protein kinase
MGRYSDSKKSLKGNGRVVETQNLAGKKLGDYVLREKLTSGGMAHIYLGEDEKLQRRAAIKVLTSDMAGNDGVLRERFEREARAIAQLEHDSIVPIYQFGEQDKLYFIAMRYIEGNDLADEMKKYKERGEKMPIERALNILGQVAEGLDHAHKRGIIHRDVKPSNILLRKSESGETGDKAVLSDFGLVLWEDVDKTLGTAFGTPRYISPEQATDSQSAVPQSDIYSLAVIVYEIVTSEVLFKGNTPMEVALSHITEPPTPPRAHNPNVPQNAQIEILKALQKDAGKRHKSAREFIDALKRAYDIEKPPTESRQSDTKPARKTAAAAIESDTTTKDMLDDSWDAIPSAKPKTSGKKDKAPAKGKQEKASTPAPVVVEVKKAEAPKVESKKPEAPKVEPKKADAPKTDKPAGSLPIPMIAGGAVGLIVVGIILYMIFGGGGGGNGGANANMLLSYNDNFIAIINISENNTLNIANLRITGSSSDREGRNFGTNLAPNACVFMSKTNVSVDTMPAAWNCTGRAVTTFQAQLFWFAESESDTSFTVYNGNSVVATCQTTGRAVNFAGGNECRINWPDQQSPEGEE